MRRKIKIPVTLTKSEMDKILDIPNERTKSGLRNKAILSLMIDSGARVSDIINLRPSNINIGKHTALVKNGKCGVDRNIPFSDYTGKLLLRYMNQRQKGPYFFNSNFVCNDPDPKKKNNVGNQLNRVYIWSLIKNLAKRAGIEKNVSCHTLRHSFALNFYKQTHNLAALQKILGHGSLSTTEIYIYMDTGDITAAAESYYGKRDGQSVEDSEIENRIKEIEKELRASQLKLEELKKLESLKAGV